MKKTIVVTGGAGFIGSTFIIHMLQNSASFRDAKIINLADYDINFGKLRLYGENTNISTNGIAKPSTIAFDHIEA